MENSLPRSSYDLDSQARLGLRTISLLVIASCFFAANVHAQDSAANSNLLGNQTEITIGGGVSVMPRYLGSSDTRIVAIPVVALQHGIFYADVVRGVGAEYSTESGFYISSALGYDEGRSTQNSTWQPGSKKLAGMGEIKGSMTFSVVAAQQLTSWLSVTAAGEFLLEGQQDRGNQYSLGLDVDLLDTKQDTITVALGAHAGDRNYNQTYFGVTHAQAQNSRFSRFDADSGIYGYSITGDWSHRFDEHWSVMTAVRVMRLAGDASNSPLTEEKTAITGIASINYSF